MLVIMSNMCYLAAILIFLVVTWWLLIVTQQLLLVTARYLVVTAGYWSLVVATARYRLLLLVPTFSMSGHQRCSMKKNVLKNFAKFIIKETLAQVSSCEFCEISNNTFFTEQL